MSRLKFVFVLLAFASAKICTAQNKALVLQNFWANDLNNYNPRPFFDDLLITLQEKLSVKKIIQEAQPVALKPDSNWNKKIHDLINNRRSAGEGSSYYIAMSTELKLPLINVGKIFFKNPPRTSKVTFTLHIYNSTGTEILADTIVNRGCISRAVDPDKGSAGFYANYQNFLDDMQCHLKVIKEYLQQKPLPQKLTHDAK